MGFKNKMKRYWEKVQFYIKNKYYNKYSCLISPLIKVSLDSTISQFKPEFLYCTIIFVAFTNPKRKYTCNRKNGVVKQKLKHWYLAPGVS